MTCRICMDNKETTHLPIYVSGSEGLEVCEDCKRVITEMIREMIRLAFKVGRVRHKIAKSLRDKSQTRDYGKCESCNSEIEEGDSYIDNKNGLIHTKLYCPVCSPDGGKLQYKIAVYLKS